jgi:pyruvate,water dikinase
MPKSAQFIRWFRDIGYQDIPAVGGKNASLGEMFRMLTGKGIRVPDGFAITSDAYRHYITRNQLQGTLEDTLSNLRSEDPASLQATGRHLRQAVLNGKMPADLADSILAAYHELSGNRSAVTDVAVRSSATAEDLPTASFAGQQETFLNVQGDAALLDSVRRCFASLFTDRAISYRIDQGFDHLKVYLSVGVQRMVRSDLASSGVMFSIDTETGFRNAVLINASWGLGENIVQGTVNPDEYFVFKPTLKAGFRPILSRHKGSKEVKLVYDSEGNKMTKNVPVDQVDRDRFALGDEDILQLARWACIIEEHYSEKNGHDTPVDIEWAKDGRTGELFIVQARPETVQSQRSKDQLQSYTLLGKGPVLATGSAIGQKIGKGRARVIDSARDLGQLQEGEVLITDKTDPDWEPSMKIASAIVTNRGGRTCHAAIVSRELGVPAVVGSGDATTAVPAGAFVTVSCAEGETGNIYQGDLQYRTDEVNISSLPDPGVKIMMNVAHPQEAFKTAAIPNSGVGLARMEFIISNLIRIHPMALINYPHLEDREAVRTIAALTADYDDKPQYFVDHLARGLAMITAAFHPHDVIVRMSDFKTNEYANLIGGAAFEPKEENPMLGFRGASRYYDPAYKQGFALECAAVRKVRDDMGLKNLKIMIPFCRTVAEGKRVISELAANGLVRGQDGLEVYVMCEIPANVILAEEFAEVFDGFSIGSNDLTQLILGVDRDSEVVAPLFDERNDAVKKMIAQVIRVAKSKHRKIGICGQAPSDYPEFARFLVDAGIDSISLNPDSVVRTMLALADKRTS